MKKFNTKTYSILLAVLALLVLTLPISIFAQGQIQQNDSEPHRIIIKKKIVTEDGKETVIEKVISGDANDQPDGIFGDQIQIIDSEDGSQREIIIESGSGKGNPYIWVQDDDAKILFKGKGDCAKARGFGFKGDGSDPSMFFLNKGMAQPGMHKLQVLTLKEGEPLPDEILAEVAEMGLDVATVQEQWEAAENMLYISKRGESGALIEVDGPEPESLKGFMLRENTQGMHFLPGNDNMNFWESDHGARLFSDEDFDFDFDFDVDQEGINSFQFEFEGEMPEGLKEKLRKHHIEIDHLGDGKIHITTPDGEHDIDVDIESDGEHHHRFRLNTQEGFPGLEKLRELEGLRMEVPGLEGMEDMMEGLNFLKNWESCDKQATEMAFLGVLLGDQAESGVLVSDVVEDSGAEKAGIQAGDIITAVNDMKVASSNELIDVIRSYKPGDQVTVHIVRDGNAQSLPATLQGKVQNTSWAKPKIEHREQMRDQFRNHFRFRYEDDTDCERLCNSPFLGVLIEDRDDAKGANITDIFEQTGAERAGLTDGDRIISINGEVMTSTSDVVAKVLSYKPGDVVEVGYIRDEHTQTVSATLGTKANSGAYNPCDCETGELKKPVDLQEIIIMKERESDVLTPQVEEETAPVAVPSEIPQVTNKPLQLLRFSLFPNPNSGLFTVSFTADKIEPVTLTVVDISGREIYREDVPDFSGTYYQDINVSDNGPGIYFLNIYQGSEVWTERFVYSKD